MPIAPPSSDDRSITCVLADDNPAILESMSVRLTANRIDVLMCVTDGAAALSAIEKVRPTVAVLAVVMSRLSGIEVARLARRSAPETAAIMYTGHNERELLVEALDAGARGFVLRETPVLELVRAIRLVAAGDIYVDPSVAPTLVRGATSLPYRALSRREREILRLLADGKSNDEIAKELSIAPDTVRTYIRRAMEKLDADTRTQAVATALRESFID